MSKKVAKAKTVIMHKGIRHVIDEGDEMPDVFVGFTERQILSKQDYKNLIKRIKGAKPGEVTQEMLDKVNKNAPTNPGDLAAQTDINPPITPQPTPPQTGVSTDERIADGSKETGK